MVHFNMPDEPTGAFTHENNAEYGALLDAILREVQHYASMYDPDNHRSDAVQQLFEGFSIFNVKAEAIPGMDDHWVATQCPRGKERRALVCTTGLKFPGSLNVYYPWSNRSISHAQTLLAGIKQLSAREQQYQAIDALPPRDDASDQQQVHTELDDEARKAAVAKRRDTDPQK